MTKSVESTPPKYTPIYNLLLAIINRTFVTTHCVFSILLHQRCVMSGLTLDVRVRVTDIIEPRVYLDFLTREVIAMLGGGSSRPNPFYKCTIVGLRTAFVTVMCGRRR